jgi:Beta-lactamase superfamily domain
MITPTLVLVWTIFGTSPLDIITNMRTLTLRDKFDAVQSEIPVYLSSETKYEVLKMFPFLQGDGHSAGSGIVTALTWNAFDPFESFLIPSCGNIRVTPLQVQHEFYPSKPRRPYFCIGFQIHDFTYLSDVSVVPDEARAKLMGTRILVLDGLGNYAHPSHFTFQQVAHLA